MNQLTPHEQQQVDTAAKAFAKTTLSNVPIGAPKTFVEDNKFKGFKAGVDFALDHLFAGRMEKFAEWCADNKVYRDTQRVQWWQRRDRYSVIFAHTTADLIAKYLQHLETIKQKEDENS